MRQTKIIKNIALILSVLIILFAIPSFFYVFFLNRYYPNIYIQDVRVEGLTKNEADVLVKTNLNLPQNLTLTYNSKNYNISLNDLNPKLSKDKALQLGLRLGRTGNVVNDLKFIISSVKSKTVVPIELSVDENALDMSLLPLEKEINVDPIDAKFEVVGGKVQNFALDQNGLKVDKDTLKIAIKNAITTNTSSEIIIPVPTTIAYAEVKSSDVNNLGIKELVGSGTSHFAGSINSRIFNINRAASIINGTLVAPDTEFSFDKIIGDISAANGYQQAYVIQNGQTVLGDGGGVCQVSTTMFRAAMNTGLPITERHAHAYRVHYYEEDADPGMDATIYTPTVDFKFKNDTGNYILIQTEIDLKNLVLTFNFYGTKDGRVATIAKPILWDAKPAPSDLYTDDPTLPVGTVKQIDFAAPGLKSKFDYIVTKNGEVINQQTFTSIFQPWQAKFLRGTKTS